MCGEICVNKCTKLIASQLTWPWPAAITHDVCYLAVHRPRSRPENLMTFLVIFLQMLALNACNCTYLLSKFRIASNQLQRFQKGKDAAHTASSSLKWTILQVDSSCCCCPTEQEKLCKLCPFELQIDVRDIICSHMHAGQL